MIELTKKNDGLQRAVVDAPKRPKPFRSKLFKLPPELLDGVDAMADDGHSADHVRKWLQENSAPPHLIPNRKTISVYLAQRRQGRAGGQQVLSDPNLGDLKDVDPGNRPELRRRSIAMVASRVDQVKRLQEAKGMDPRWERTMVDHLDLLRKLMESADEANAEAAYWEGFSTLIIRKFLFELAHANRIAVEKVYGSSRTNEVLGHLDRESKKIDFARIRREAVEEMDAGSMGQEAQQA